MSLSLFQNYKVPLSVAGVTLVGVALFADSLSTPNLSESDVAQESEAVVEVAAPTANMNKSKPVQNEQPVIPEFNSDAELIDDAAGFDPSPQVSGEPQATTTETVVTSDAAPEIRPRRGEGLVRVQPDPNLSREEGLQPTQ